MERFNRFIYGFLVGLLLPFLFMWLYLALLYPGYEDLGRTLSLLFPGVLFAKMLMLSTLPNLLLTFVFYKSDSFKIAIGSLSGAMPYLIASLFML